MISGMIIQVHRPRCQKLSLPYPGPKLRTLVQSFCGSSPRLCGIFQPTSISGKPVSWTGRWRMKLRQWKVLDVKTWRGSTRKPWDFKGTKLRFSCEPWKFDGGSYLDWGYNRYMIQLGLRIFPLKHCPLQVCSLPLSSISYVSTSASHMCRLRHTVPTMPGLPYHVLM